MAGETNGVVARRVLVSGRVQGVWYRESCQRQARAAGVRGWVRNRDDGRVEVWMEGQVAAVDSLEGWCRVGPSRALVTAVTVEERPSTDCRDFEVVS